MKKILSVLLIVVLAAGLLVACGGSQAPSQTQSPGATNAPETKSPDQGSSEKVTLTIAIWGDENRKKTFEELFTGFEQKYNCDVVVNLVAYQDYATKLATQLTAGNAPDVVWLADGMERQFLESGNLVDISSYVKNDPDYNYADFYETAMSAITDGDKVFGIPFSFGPRVVYVNKTLFEKAGVKLPSEYLAEGKWTYETMYELARKLTDKSKGQYGLKLWDTSSATNYVYAFYDLVLAYGADYFNKDTTDFTLNTPEGIKAVQAVYDVIYKDQSHLKPGDATEFTAGTIAMARSTFSYAKTIKGQNVDFEWEVVPVPTGPDADAPVITGFAYYSVTTNSKNPQLAAELVKYMTTIDMMKTMVNTFVAPRASLLNSDEFLQQEGGKPTKEEILRSFVAPIEERGLRPYPAHKNFTKIQDQITMDFDNYFAGVYSSAEEMVKAMEQAVRALLNQ
ncbi:MAG: sugar ABC transporter substrate-binding protein [Clostridiaceae bacterium]|nr:sugar ABC transporter substrate-binding protein [Clostridiaceae bacterium]